VDEKKTNVMLKTKVIKRHNESLLLSIYVVIIIIYKLILQIIQMVKKQLIAIKTF